jgi:hypothetical protein
MKITKHNKQYTNNIQIPMHNGKNVSLFIRSLYIVCNLLLVFCILGFNDFTYALSINIDPSNIKLVMKPGEVKTGEILVQNLGGTKLKIMAYTQDWIYAPDGSKTFMKPGSSVYSCSSWIKLDPINFILAPKEDKKVKYTITSPSNASGGHVSVIFFEAVMDAYQGIAVSGRLGSIVYLDTEGDIKRAGEIKNLSVLASEEGDPVILNFSFINSGNSYISAKPVIKVLDGGKVVVEKQAMNINSLPGDTKSTIVTIKEPLKEGKYKAQVELTFDNKTLKSQSDFTIRKSARK